MTSLATREAHARVDEAPAAPIVIPQPHTLISILALMLFVAVVGVVIDLPVLTIGAGIVATGVVIKRVTQHVNSLS